MTTQADYNAWVNAVANEDARRALKHANDLEGRFKNNEPKPIGGPVGIPDTADRGVEAALVRVTNRNNRRLIP